MKLALAQLNSTVGDLAGNSALIARFYQQAVTAGAELVVTPELAITGYPPRDLLAKRRFVEDNLAALTELAAHIGEIPLLVGYVDFNPRPAGRTLHNAVAFLHHGEVHERRFKTLLPTYDVFDEDRYFEPGLANEPILWNNHRWGVTVCEDIWMQDTAAARLYNRDPVRELTAAPAGVELLINLSASPFHVNKPATRRAVLGRVARREGIPLVYCNLVGGNDELVFDGNSLVLDARGEPIAQAAAFAEDLVLVDLPAVAPAAAAVPAEPSAIAAIHDALVLGLRDYTRKCGFRSVVLGLSGGIDSAVTACLAVAALGPANVVGVAMPSAFSSAGSVDDARALAANLGIRYEQVPIGPVFEQFKTTLAGLFAGRAEDTTEENLQARTRGNILMAISNKFGHLLLTTGNKSEMAVGYCTLYGDMAGGLAVIADVPKTMVYELARYINRAGVRIPAETLTKPPSAELRPDQTDQDSLPPYAVLDAILKRYVEEHQSAAEIVAATGLEPGVVREIIRKIDLNEYKRKQAPPCLRVTTKAFGVGRRVPIAQRYVERPAT